MMGKQINIVAVRLLQVIKLFLLKDLLFPEAEKK